MCPLSDGVGGHQQSGMCRQEVLQHVCVWEHVEGGDAAGLQLLHEVRITKTKQHNVNHYLGPLGLRGNC